MPRFAANLSMMYTELPFVQRWAAAAADGFAAVECQFPYEAPAAELAATLQANGLAHALINAPPGNWAAGERGIAGIPGREAEFRDGFLRQAIPYAQALGCPRIHVMAGLATAGAQRGLYAQHLAWAAEQAAPAGLQILIEPLNPRDVPGYLVSRQHDAHALVQEVGAANLAVQMDLYHTQIVHGDVAMHLREWLPTGRVGHLQIAGVPERQEPDIGELNHFYLFDLLDQLGWTGWIGCEYRPRAGTSAGLGWFQRYKAAQRA